MQTSEYGQAIPQSHTKQVSMVRRFHNHIQTSEHGQEILQSHTNK